MRDSQEHRSQRKQPPTHQPGLRQSSRCRSGTGRKSMQKDAKTQLFCLIGSSCEGRKCSERQISYISKIGAETISARPRPQGRANSGAILSESKCASCARNATTSGITKKQNKMIECLRPVKTLASEYANRCETSVTNAPLPRRRPIRSHSAEVLRTSRH